MSNRSGRSWYRLSSIVRPTPYSSRDPSPPPPPSPPPQPPLPPPSPRSPPKEANPSHVPLSMSTKHETTHPENILKPPYSSRDPSPLRHVINPPPSQPPLPPPSPPRSPPNEIKEANTSTVQLSMSTKQDPRKTGHKHETTHHPKKILTPPHSSRDPSPLRHVINPPLFPPSPPPSPRSLPKEMEEAKPSPVSSSLFTKHDPPNAGDNSLIDPSLSGHKHEITHSENTLTPSEKTNIVHGPDQQKDFNLSSSTDQFHDPIVNTELGFIIIISGENKGAAMEILWSLNKTRGFKSSSDDEEGNESKSKKQSNINGDDFVNSNVQMINSSVVYSSTGTAHHDPGVHLSLYRKPSSGNGFITKDHGNGYTSSIN